jgi:hypothetical protein
MIIIGVVKDLTTGYNRQRVINVKGVIVCKLLFGN